jgi:hypothetical protein
MQRDYPKVWGLDMGLADANIFVALMDEVQSDGVTGEDAIFDSALKLFKKRYEQVDDGIGGKKWVLRKGQEGPAGEPMTPPRFAVLKVETFTARLPE